MLRRLLVTATAAVIVGGALVSCGDGADSGEALRWRTAVDVPVNVSLLVRQDLGSAPLVPVLGCADLFAVGQLPDGINCDSLSPVDSAVVSQILDSLVAAAILPDTSILVDLGADTISTGSDVTDFLEKLTDTNIKYKVMVTNRTSVALTFYGMLFPKSDSAAARDSIERYYGIIKSNDTSNGRVNVFPPQDTMKVEPGGTKAYECTSKAVGKTLADLIIRKPRAFSWRWLVRAEKGDYGSLGNNAETADSVDIKLRINFSGVNSMDSLFSL